MNSPEFINHNELLKQNKPYSTALKHGLFLSIITILIDIVLNMFGVETYNSRSFYSMLQGIVLGSVTIFFATKENRLQLNNFMPFKRVLLIGFLIGLFSGIITAIYFFIKFTYLVDISSITEVEVLKQLEETSAGLSPEELEETRAMALKFSRIFSKPIIMAPLSILNSILGMFVLSVFVGLGVRKEFNKYE